MRIDDVVVPVLTPDGYNLSSSDNRQNQVVVPVLTPDGYNKKSHLRYRK